LWASSILGAVAAERGRQPKGRSADLEEADLVIG
jgi:hypothetical protein